MAIRYDKKLNQEINRTIRNFNQKIARLEKEQRDLILPDKITKKELKQSNYNRKELRRKLKELQLYSKRGIERTITTSTGLQLSKYEYTNLKNEQRRLKSSLTREINRLKTTQPSILGKKQSGTFQQMGDEYLLNLQSRRQALDKNIQKLNKEEFKRYKQLINKSRRNKEYYSELFKNNYLDMLFDLGYFYGYDNDKIKEIREKIKQLDNNKFLQLFQNEQALKSITDYYPTMKNIKNNNYDEIKEDVKVLYDAIYNNIDEILKEYA